MNGYNANLPLTRKQVTLIHVAKTQCGMDDAEYRAQLEKFGVGSSKDLKQHQFDAVMSAFKANGFTDAKQKSRNARRTPKKPHTSSKQAMIAKINAICAEKGVGLEYVDGICRKRFGKMRIEFCTDEEVRKVLQMMVIHQERNANTEVK